MARNIFKISTVALLACTGLANAGGFSRGTADTDIIYEDGNFNIRAGATFVSPTRKITKGFVAPVFGGSNVGHDNTNSFVIPSAAIKLNVTDDLRCSGSLSTPYGGDADWRNPSGTSGKLSEKFVITELAATCGYKFDLSKGQAWVLGGIYHETFNYNLSAVGGAVNVKLNSTDVGFRLGAAYAIPEIALRAEVMYRSGTRHEATGTTTRLAPTGTALDGLPLGFAVPVAKGDGNLPQSVDVKIQSGVAPGWLVFGSVKWTDWSVNNQLNLVLAPGAVSANIYNWRDGVTVSAGVGHAFNEKLSGAASLTYDRGVGTGWDLSADSWTLGAGGSYKDDLGGELKVGGGITYLAGAAETKYAAPLNSAVAAGWAWALGASYKTKW
jgi:long-chain fatty acid transport protein